MHGIRIVIESTANARHQGTVRGIMEILGLLPDAVMAGILQATLDAPLAWSFVAYKEVYQFWS